MRLLFLAFLLATLGCASAVTTRSFGPRAPLPSPLDAGATPALVDTNGDTVPPLTTVYYFDQLIDHTNPSKGTFQQRYWMTWSFYENGTLATNLFAR